MVWKKKKFWKSIRLYQKESEFGILLDNNLLKTPKKKDCMEEHRTPNYLYCIVPCSEADDSMV